MWFSDFRVVVRSILIIEFGVSIVGALEFHEIVWTRYRKKHKFEDVVFSIFEVIYWVFIQIVVQQLLMLEWGYSIFMQARCW